VASQVDICNLGLAHIGAEAQVASISPPEGSVEAGLCSRFYPIVRKELLESANWQFALKRVQLAEVANPSTVWQFAYALPSDCIDALRILPLAVIGVAAIGWDGVLFNGGLPDTRLLDDLFTERGSMNFEIEGEVLLTNEPMAVLKYKRDVTDTTKFTGQFVSAFGMLMASYLSGPLIKGQEGTRIGASWRESAMAMTKIAAAGEANNSHEGSEFTPSSIRARVA
jgi:hypothetical protein